MKCEVVTSIIFYPTSFTNYTTLGNQAVGVPVGFAAVGFAEHQQQVSRTVVRVSQGSSQDLVVSC